MNARETYAKLHANTSGPHHQGQTSLEAQAALDEIDCLRDHKERLRTELAKHGWGDFHYGSQPQDPEIVALLEATS